MIVNEKDKKIRVLIDLDGVLRDFIEGLKRVYRREYPDHEIAEVTSRKLDEFFPIGKEIYPFIEEKFLDEILEAAPAYPGAIEALHRWETDFEMVIVTAQPPRWRYATFVWRGKNKVPADEVLIRFDKHRISGVALLDDFVDNLEAFAATGRLAVCLDRPWNRSWKGPRVTTVNDFFILVLDELNSEQKEKEENIYFT